MLFTSGKASPANRDPASRRDPFFSFPAATALLACLLAICALAYAPGLGGPLLLDDQANLSNIERWHAGKIDWATALFANSSGPGGRPLSIASFLLSTAIGGFSEYSLKSGNLILHLINGILIFLLFSRLGRIDPWMRHAPLTAALLATGLWLLHPLLVSTTLYAIQRMAILSATFTLLGLLSYIHGRSKLAEGVRTGYVHIFGFVPFFTMAAFYSKENGLLTPLLCAVLELAYFRNKDAAPKGINVFLVLTLVLPLVALGILLLSMPELIIAGYENRPFTLYERLITQSRVLFEYASSIALPQGPTLSIFRDDYPKSTGLLSPVSTLASIAGWFIIVSSAVALRTRLPAVTAGVGLFLIGHSMESSIFPLFLYFEHRNYLPAVGLIWAILGVAAPLAAAFNRRSTKALWIMGIGALALILMLAVATNARARVWATEEAILQSSEDSHPDSAWLRMSQAQHYLAMTPARPDLARSSLEAALRSESPATRQIGILGIAAVDCHAYRRVDPAIVDGLFEFPARPVQADLSRAIRTLAEVVRAKPCENLSPQLLADTLTAWLDSSDLPERFAAKSRLRYETALLYAKARDFPASYRQASLAFSAGRTELPVAALRVGALAGAGCVTKARAELNQLRMRTDASTRESREFLDAYEAQLSQLTDDPTGKCGIEAQY